MYARINDISLSYEGYQTPNFSIVGLDLRFRLSGLGSLTDPVRVGFGLAAGGANGLGYGSGYGFGSDIDCNLHPDEEVNLYAR